jgi:two-component sensor histidine kinase
VLPKHVEFGKTIHAAGTDLLNLISDILDLSKIESGTVTVECEQVAFSHVRETLERGFRHEADAKGLTFTVEADPKLSSSITTDSKRSLQILKNLVSNAFKFTEQGSVRVRVAPASKGWTLDHPILSQAESVIAFSVTDTGIGIPPEKHRIIFEAFQQADAGTSRRYGGTGLGLAISRELAHLLGGEIRMNSSPGAGSTFTLYLPLEFMGAASAKTGAPPTRTFQPLAVPVRVEDVPDDRHELLPDDRVLLVVEDDPTTRKWCSVSRASAASKSWSRRTAPKACDWRGSTSRRRFRSTCSCPTCSAGPCSIS